MIIRILGEGQYEIPETERRTLEGLDAALVGAVDGGHEAAFAAALGAIIDEVRQAGQALADDAFAPSDLVVPFADATLAETKTLLADSGDAVGPDDR
ncbi:MAG: PspA-associated protein PspAA [Acidimicrobiales bacterium]